MKWILIFVAVVIVLVGLVALVGSLLPEGHRASRSARFSQPPEVVWRVITDFASAPTWRKELKSVERLPDRNGHPAWVEITRRDRLPFEVVEADSARRLVTVIIDEDMPFGGSWTYELQPEAGGTRLTITENGKIYNPIFRFAARFFFGYHRTLEAYLKNLGEKFGEHVDFQTTGI